MKHVLAWCAVVMAIIAPTAYAVEILQWQRLPLAVPLIVGQERIVFIDRNVRVGVPGTVGDKLRVQSAAGAIYLRANEPIAPTRLQLQDVDSGALILVDIAARPADGAEAELEPVRIVEGDTPALRYGQYSAADGDPADPAPAQSSRRETPVAVVLTRYAAQNLYVPLRTVEPVAGVRRVNLRGSAHLDTLLPTLPVRAIALAAWRLEDQWVTAVRLTNTGAMPIELDPRALQGNFVTATFQHETLGPHGKPEDTTVLYLVTRDHDLWKSILPAIHRFDPAAPLQKTAAPSQEASHAQ